MRVRKNANRDIPVMIETWNDTQSEGGAWSGKEMYDANTGDDFFTSLTYCGVAVDFGGNIHGFYALNKKNDTEAEALFVVRKASRNQKVGQDLMNDCLKVAKDKGFVQIILEDVKDENEIAKHVFEKAGFEKCGDTTYKKSL
ncbi:MAG: GNAT family N-acetyltransferase [Lachnospiraceae bacterium]|nr:GNAT family N-acetyltransferase [Lachnospiraceae bacterium]